MNVKRKLLRMRDLLSEGKLDEFFTRVLNKLPFYRELEYNAEYLYLRHKYRTLLDVHPDQDKLLTGGIRILYGGYGFRALTKHRKSARLVSPH